MHYKGHRFLTPLLLVLVWANVEAQTAQPVPRLVVNVMVDQLRTDYLEAFSSLFGPDGFNRMLREGRTYVDASYPFSNIDRASAVASVMTGSVPYDNGIVGERWMDRKTLRPMFCVDDASCQGWLTSEKYSPSTLNVSTITDELKVATNGRALVYGIAPEPDAAILSAGHAADGAFWIDNASGQWSSTSYYGEYPNWALSYEASERLASRISDLSWTPAKAVTDVLEIGKTYQFKVLKVDQENKKVSIGYKQLQPQPWDLVAEKYAVGDVISGKVVRLVPFGAFVEVEKGIDGLVHVSQIAYERVETPASVLNVGDEVEAKIISLDPAAKKMNLSIKACLPEPERKPRAERSGDEAPRRSRAPRRSDDEYSDWNEGSISIGTSLGDLLANAQKNNK